jgi:hypothetical protein
MIRAWQAHQNLSIISESTVFCEGQVINENARDEQIKIIKYNYLVANLLIFHNVNSMTKVLNNMIKEGFEISEEILANLAPYRTENFNRFGAYDMRFDRVPEPLGDSFYSPVNLMN